MSRPAKAGVGDLVVVQGHRVGATSRTGEIVEVLGAAGHEHYRVQWEDGRESLFTPGSDAVVRHVERSAYEEEPVLIHEP